MASLGIVLAYMMIAIVLSLSLFFMSTLATQGNRMEEGRLVGWLGETHHVVDPEPEPNPSHLSSPRTVWDTDELTTVSGVHVPLYTLNNGVKMPAIGFGTCLGGGTYAGVKAALAAGYRHIDSAQAREWYREDLVGNAIRDSGVPREELFITSKLHPRHLGYETTLRQFEESLDDLHTTYVDLFLLHYPNCWGSLCGGKEPEGTWRDSWRAMEELVQAGKIRAIGMSNVDRPLMTELLGLATIPPAVIQVYSDPLRPNLEMQAFCKDHNIQFEAYSSLGTQWWFQLNPPRNPILSHPKLVALGEEMGRSAAQVVLRWAIHHGQVVIPRSSKPDRIAENLDVMSFQLSNEQIAIVDALANTKP